MKAKKIFAIFGTVALLALLWVASGVVAGPPAEGPEGEGEVTIASTVSSRISYQGVLKESGQPVTGSRDMTFRLYSDENCNTQVDSIVKSDVEVTDGLFSVDLDVTHSHFNGQGLWLKVFVDGTGLGCEEILPVPYALSLRPGADIIGSIDGDSVLEARNESSADGSKGVFGYASATSGITYGVYGESKSSDGSGGYFKNTAGDSIKVSAGDDGVHVGSAGDDGVYIRSAGSDGVYVESAGVKGVYVGSAGQDGVYIYSADRDGVYVESAGSNGVQVYSATHHGVYIRSAGWDGVRVASAGHHGGYFINATTDHPTLNLYNGASGDLIEAYTPGGLFPDLEFKVHGNGNVTADGSFTGGGADFAEMMAVDGDPADYEPGDVLVISSAKDRAVELSSKPYATNVVGIYSAKPGFVGTVHDPHETNPDEIPVAISGIVLCKVSAENGAIKRGDLLTTSSTPGYAMKAEPIKVGGVEFYPPGTIIGKALEELEQETGVILVLVTLQ